MYKLWSDDSQKSFVLYKKEQVLLLKRVIFHTAWNLTCKCLFLLFSFPFFFIWREGGGGAIIGLWKVTVGPDKEVSN